MQGFTLQMDSNLNLPALFRCTAGGRWYFQFVTKLGAKENLDQSQIFLKDFSHLSSIFFAIGTSF